MDRKHNKNLRIHDKIFTTPDEVHQSLFQQWRNIASAAIEKNGYCTVALSGGNTPQKLFRNLRESLKNDFWENTGIFMVDERFVPENHPDSNQKMIRENLLGQDFNNHPYFYPIPIMEDVKKSAQAYQDILINFFSLKPGELPVFDLILLGIGEDGHTASLFPEDLKKMETQNLVLPIHLEKLKQERITLTLPVLNQAKNIIFLVLGREKAGIVKTLLAGDDRRLPAARIAPKSGNLFFYLDYEAASLLDFPKK